MTAPHEACPLCKDIPDVAEVGSMPSGYTGEPSFPAWYLQLDAVTSSLRRCRDCGTEYDVTREQTHDHWWNDSWTEVRRRREPG